jgi:hypothetical protein
MNWLRDDPLTAILAYLCVIGAIVLGIVIIMHAS